MANETERNDFLQLANECYDISEQIVKDNSIQLMKTLLPYNHKYKAYAEGIKWVLNNYKVI